MTSPKKRVDPLFVALAVVLVAVAAAVGVVFFQLHSKISYGKTTNMNRIKGSAIWQTNKNEDRKSVV